MKILVTGSAGLIGHAVCKHLNPENTVYGYDINPNYIHTSGMYNAEVELSEYFHNKNPLIFDAFIDCARYGKPSEQFLTWNTIIGHFKRHNTGKLILFSSIYGHTAPNFGIYPGTEIPEPPIEYAIWKGGTEQATRYLAQKLKPWHIQVNCIAPGGVLDKHSETFQEEYHTAGFADMIKPANILPVVDMLLHPDNAVNGQVITCDFGWSL